ncbi:unnamed protein product [Hyaloperonospora brassicae]|uniref:RxLR effector candidate protein n=1 Tax=Hyaloperonospora brassicae TaxID=162125 RepID=A0AAV0TEB1_HYABA|nr:unnamed protein product [Hyaloperonospora brassicae]
MRFHSSLVLPLAVFAACCSADSTAERRLRSQDAGEDAGTPPKMDISVLSNVPEDQLEKQIRKFVSKVPLPEGITEEQMVKLTLNALERAKEDGSFAEELQHKAEEVQKKMEQAKKRKRQEEDGGDEEDEGKEDEKSAKKPKVEEEDEKE